MFSAPKAMIIMRGGLAMLRVLQGAVTTAFKGPFAFGAMVSFLVTVAALQLFGIGAAFWARFRRGMFLAGRATRFPGTQPTIHWSALDRRLRPMPGQAPYVSGMKIDLNDPVLKGHRALPWFRQKGGSRMSASIIDVQEFINSRPFGPFQIAVLTLCFLVVAADGFDTAAVGFIAPALRAQWNLSPTQLAPLFAAGLFGLKAVAVLFGPVADRGVR